MSGTVMFSLVWLSVVLGACVVYLQVYSRFSKYGVRHFKPVPLLGNVGRLMLQKHHIGEDMKMLCDAFPDDRFVGRYEMMRPVVLIRDPDLIKQITVKDYEYFLDHRTIVDETVDTLFGRSLVAMKGQEWKDMRSTLSPAFTSSKIRNMVPFMAEVNQQMVSSLKNKIQQSGADHMEVECKELTMRYANDVIPSCAFGVKVNSHTEEQNQFYSMGKKVGKFDFRRILIFFGYGSFPGLMKKLNQKLYGDDIRNFFSELVMSNMRERELHNIFRPDMIHLLMETKKGTLTRDDKTLDTDAGFAAVQESAVGKKVVNRSWSDDDLISQAFLFFIASFETVSSTMSFLLHELAVNPEVQERLVQEIRDTDAKCGGKLDYSSIQNMAYMDMVVSEVLRLWPPAIGLDRKCIKDYNLGKSHDKAQDYIIRRGEAVTIPVWTIHRDPAHFPDPDKFDPERFNVQNKQDIKLGSYLPFGSGPRNCIGSRFALCEVKVMLYQFLQHLEVSPCSKTCIPAKLSPANFTLSTEGGHWVRVTTRK